MNSAVVPGLAGGVAGAAAGAGAYNIHKKLNGDKHPSADPKDSITVESTTIENDVEDGKP